MKPEPQIRRNRVRTSQQKGHNHCVCGHLDAHHRLWDGPGSQPCRMNCVCEHFQSKPYETKEE